MMSLDGEYVSHHSVSVFKNPRSIRKEPACQQQSASKRRFLPFSFFLMFPPSLPSFPNSCERDSVFVVVIVMPPACFPSRWVPYLKWKKAIMASVWITTDYNNCGCGGCGAAEGDKWMPGIFSSSSSPSFSLFLCLQG